MEASRASALTVAFDAREPMPSASLLSLVENSREVVVSHLTATLVVPYA